MRRKLKTCFICNQIIDLRYDHQVVCNKIICLHHVTSVDITQKQYINGVKGNPKTLIMKDPATPAPSETQKFITRCLKLTQNRK